MFVELRKEAMVAPEVRYSSMDVEDWSYFVGSRVEINGDVTED